MRLDKYLADMNVGTRSDLKKAVRKGLVLVNDAVVRDPAFQVNGTETVIFDGMKIHYAQTEYLMMNKPVGVISASEDRRQKTVIDLLDGEHRKDLFPVGRLDKDAHGLLLLTNDGELAHRLLSPKKHVDKVYLVQAAGNVTDGDVEKFRTGIRYDRDLTAAPAGMEVLNRMEGGCTSISVARVTIHEGKFHQIKKMFDAIEKPVLDLKRIQMGPLVLDESLEEGQYRPLTEDELQMLLRAAQMDE